MSVRITEASLRNFATVTLQNDSLRVMIIPALGGRIWELEDRLRGRQWIWHRDDVPLQAVPPGSNYDDAWAGGWEELFPNDAPTTFEGRLLPDHGEWWTLPWRASTAPGPASADLVLSASCKAVRADCTKEITLSPTAPELTIRYRIRSREQKPFHFLFKQHLPVAINPACRLVLPGGRVEPVDPDFSGLLPGPSAFEWPVMESGEMRVDMREIPPPSSATQEFVYVSRLVDGWCGVMDQQAGASLRMSFDLATLPFVWLFLSYGGWRGLYTAVLEPCSNLPKDLDSAVASGRSASLAPDEEFTTSVTVVLGGNEAMEP